MDYVLNPTTIFNLVSERILYTNKYNVASEQEKALNIKPNRARYRDAKKRLMVS